MPPYWRDALSVGFFSILRVKGSSVGVAKLHRADFIDPLIHVKFRRNYMVQGDQSPEPFQKFCDNTLSMQSSSHYQSYIYICEADIA